ncbi:MAG: rhomboid family intramembrane serine protease [Bacteroidota bacterium]
MKQARTYPFGSTIEAVMYPFLLLALLWSIYLLEGFYPNQFIQLGILPQQTAGLKGIFFSPLIHSPSDVMHLVNNSLPGAVLFGALVYFYRQVAAQVFFLSWILTGLFVWLFAQNNGSYHIGFSGMIYALAGFLFTSGTLRKFRPLQGISLFVAFIYGSMIWGIFPTQERISWEGHLSGLMIGVLLAFIYRKKGPQPPKYQFEIEKELGIEPPDLEGIWNENIRMAQEQQEILERIRSEEEMRRNSNHLDVFLGQQPQITYDFKRKGEEDKPEDQSSTPTSGR